MSQRRVIPARVVEHQPEAIHVAVLAGVGVLRRRRAISVAHFSPRLVAYLRDLRPAGIGRDACASELVREQVR